MRYASNHHHRQWQLFYDFSDCPCHESISVAKNGAIIRWYKGSRIALGKLAAQSLETVLTVLEEAKGGASKCSELCGVTAAALSYFLPGKSSSFAAILTNSANDSACIFRITWPRWTFTVISLVPSSEAICLFSIPNTTKLMTSRSRVCSALWRLCKSASAFCCWRVIRSRSNAWRIAFSKSSSRKGLVRNS